MDPKAIIDWTAIFLKLIDNIPAILVGLGAVVIPLYSAIRTSSGQAEIKHAQKLTDEKISSVKAATDGMKDELVRVTRSDAIQEGIGQGKLLQKVEEINKTAIPSEVAVILKDDPKK